MASSNSVTLDYWELCDCETDGYVIAASLIFYIAVGVPMNVLILITIFTDKIYQRPTVVLLAFLSSTNTVILLSTFPYLVTIFAGKYILGSTDQQRCSTCRFLLIFDIFYYIPWVLIVLLSLDRFMYVYKPLKYERVVTSCKMVITVLLVLTVYLVIGFVQNFYPANYRFISSTLSCRPMYTDVHSVIYYTVNAAFVIVIILCNCLFTYIVWKNIRAVYKGSSSGVASLKLKCCCFKKHLPNTHSQKQHKLNCVFLGLFTPSMISWIVYVFSCTWYGDGYSCGQLGTCFIISYLTSILHPVIEMWLLPDVRKSLKLKLTRPYKILAGKYKLHQKPEESSQ